VSIDLQITSLRLNQESPNHDVTVLLKPKYTGERRYSMPRECLDDLRADFERLGTGRDDQPRDKGQIQVKAPKKWMVGSGLPQHQVVFLIFDPQTDAQAGFALSADAANAMAAELVKRAQALNADANGGGKRE
jgi:hypothetical protein